MAFLVRLLRNRNFVLLLALVLGLVVGEGVAVYTESLVLPALGLVMTLSAASVTTRELASFKTMPTRILVSLLLNYVVLGGIILVLAYFLIDDRELWAGFVVISTVPPAVAVLPFSAILGGDTVFSLVGVTGAYLAALAITPLVTVLILGADFFNPIKLLLILAELIIIPLLLSRVLLATGLMRKIQPWRGTIVNWSFFLVTFTAVGLNRQAFLSEFGVLAKMALIAIVVSFVLGYAIKAIAHAMQVKPKTSVSLVLMGTMKNYGLASGILLTLFNERSAIPASILMVFGVLQMIWLVYLFPRSETSQD